METFSVSRNGVWFTRSGRKEAAKVGITVCREEAGKVSAQLFFSYTRSINLLKNPFSLVIKLL